MIYNGFRGLEIGIPWGMYVKFVYEINIESVYSVVTKWGEILIEIIAGIE